MGKLLIRTSAQLHAIAVNLISRKKTDPNRFIYTQGCGVFGSLGQGDDLADSPSFKKLNLSGANADDIDVKDISAGWGHTAVATVDGNLVVFGRPYDDLTIKTVNRIKGYSASFGRYYGKWPFLNT